MGFRDVPVAVGTSPLHPLSALCAKRGLLKRCAPSLRVSARGEGEGDGVSRRTRSRRNLTPASPLRALRKEGTFKTVRPFLARVCARGRGGGWGFETYP